MSRPSWKYKIFWFFLFCVAYAVFYVLPNLRPPFAVSYLPVLDVDRFMPFVPWTFIVYLSDYLLFIIVLCRISTMDLWHSFARMCFGTLFICGLFFLLFPTTYPRPPYPEVDNWVVSVLMYLIHELDTPNNCFPSMHVSMTAVAAWTARLFGRKMFLLYIIWALAIFISTMTTKQHYFMDILGGLGVTVVIVFLEWFFFEKGWYRELCGKFAS